MLNVAPSQRTGLVPASAVSLAPAPVGVAEMKTIIRFDADHGCYLRVRKDYRRDPDWYEVMPLRDEYARACQDMVTLFYQLPLILDATETAADKVRVGNHAATIRKRWADLSRHFNHIH